MTAEPTTIEEHTAEHRGVLPVIVAAIAAGTTVNLALYAAGRLAGAAMSLDPAIGPAGHDLTAFDVAWKTGVPLGLAAGVLLLARLRSRSWVTAVIVTGVVVAVGTGAVPPLGAHDGLTAVLLAGMHTVPGVALVWMGLAVRRSTRR